MPQSKNFNGEKMAVLSRAGPVYPGDRLVDFLRKLGLSATFLLAIAASEVQPESSCWPWVQERADRLSIEGRPLITENVSSAPNRFRPQPPVVAPRGIKITYLGTGGFLIERGQRAILTAPFFSNNSLWRVGVWKLDVRENSISRYTPNLKNAQAILVGHAHYDHLLDIPYLWRHHANHTIVYGNRSMGNILAGADTPVALQVLEHEVRRDGRSGAFKSTHRGQIQFMAIKSGHAPNFRLPPLDNWGLPLKISPWSVEEPVADLPRRTRGWRMGDPLAYIIDFRDPADTSRVDFRIYYQDAGHIPEAWHWVESAVDSVDLAIVTVASSNLIGQREFIRKVRAHIKPRHWLLGHWEDFFKVYSQDPESICSVPFTNPEGFVKKLLEEGVGEERWVLPTPGTVLNY